MYDGHAGELPPMLDEDTRRGYWPQWIPKPRQLTALCLPGWHANDVGEPYRWADENIRLSDTVGTSHFEWHKWCTENRYGRGFPRTVFVECGKCGRVTRHAAKGWKWAM